MTDKPTRRAFFGQAGATLTAPLAATVAFGGELHGRGFVAGRLESLDDVNAIRALERRYARLVGSGNTEAIAALFADPARASVDGHVRSVVIDGDDKITVLADGTATSRVACTVTTATPIEDCGTLVEMARLQGDGFVKRTEPRELVASFVKLNGSWQLDSAEFHT
jgi:hypothetical protein